MPNGAHSEANGAIASSNGGGLSPRWTNTRLRQRATEIGVSDRSSGQNSASSPKSRAALSLPSQSNAQP